MDKRLRRISDELIGLVYPRICAVCGAPLVADEDTLCLKCHTEIPRTHCHNDDFGIVHRRLASTIPIERGASFFFYYKNNPYARLIQEAKYNDAPYLATFLARTYATEIVGDGFFDGIDALVPVPLHRLKRWRRGYNQAEKIIDGIKQIVPNLPMRQHLKALSHSTQTAKNAFERFLNTRQTYYAVDTDALTDKHILIVDDIITTGATTLSCCEAIHNANPSTKISILSLAITHEQ